MKKTTKTFEISEIPPYGLRAYALFFSRHSTREEFSQNELNWIVGQSMKKKIFALLLNSGWIEKKTNNKYICINPAEVFRKMLDFKVPKIMEQVEREYAFTGLSAVEIWSDYSYIQRGIEKSPYFIKVLKKDLKYWKNFFNRHKIPNYVNSGSTIGEFIILIPVKRIEAFEKDNLKVETLNKTMQQAKANSFYTYAYNYMKEKYGRITA
ncbi:hypothetical protein HZA33_02030 [Candidatus Pacearchaeota archaeon]|nr:hypothetical protein [Candidatus Pacearchaeota archaeon]